MKIPIDQIQYEGRTVDQGEIDSLAASIKEKGLLHPITVSVTGGIDGSYQLVTGLKRLLAAKQNEENEIEVSIIEGSGEEIHIHENLMRYNLPWYEQVELRAQLHTLRQQQKGKANPRSGVKDGWSLRDTAKELQVSLGTIAQDMQLMEYMQKDPSLKNIKDKPTALKMMKQNMRRLEAEMESTNPSGIEENQVLCANSLDILPSYPKGVFHACITDPPWLDFHMDETLERDLDTILVFKEIFRVLRQDSFLYAFVGMDDFSYYREELPKLGFEFSKTPLIWVKGNVVSMGKRAWEYDRDYELILVAAKGSPILVNSGRRSSILTFPAIPGALLKHPNEKPETVVEELIKDSTYENALILDPFMGAGTVPRVCKRLGRRYIGIEREHKYFEIAERGVQ